MSGRVGHVADGAVRLWHSMCGGCVLQIRSVYDEQAGTSLQDQIDLTYDGTQPSYAAPPRCPYKS